MCDRVYCGNDFWMCPDECPEGEDVVILSDQNAEETALLKLGFIELLVADDPGALQAARDFFHDLDAEDLVEAPTEVYHTIWSRPIEDENGYFRYHINHGLSTKSVLLSVDSLAMWSFKATSEDQVVVLSPESLWGCDVSVYLKEESDEEL